jgi:multiple sugar transport system permease protein/raffinose/stachyose/melibiose transport system permease protein
MNPRELLWRRRRKKLSRVVLYVLVLMTLLVFVGPIAWMFSVAVKSPEETFEFPPTFLPVHPTLMNFQRALNPVFLRYGLNSIIVSTATTALTIFFAVFSSYSFSRLRFKGRKLLLVLILLTQLLPLAVLIVPIFRIMSGLGMINTYPALMIAYMTFTIPVAVWFLRGFFYGIPYELEEAAMIDGCTRLRAFLSVILPLSLPGISATGTYVFFVTWQELMFSLAFITTKDMRTLPVGVLDFIGEHVTDWGALMAASILVCVPVFLLFVFMQNQLIAGLTEGAIKG